MEAIRAAERAEAAYDRRMYRYKAHYSLDCDNGIENAVLLKPQTPEMVLEEKQFQEQVYAAVMKLPEKQAKRIYARYYLGMTVNEIAEVEGVDPSRVRDSMRNAGYTDVERGERGSSEEHLTVTQFKVEREQERLEQLTAQTQQKEQQAASLEKKLEKIQKQQIAVQKVEQIETHAIPFSSKVMLDRSEYENLAAAAKKFYIQDRKESKLQKALEAAMKMITKLKAKVAALMAELAEYKSVRGQLSTAGLEQQNELLRNKLHRYETVIERNGLWNLFRPSRKPDYKRQEER